MEEKTVNLHDLDGYEFERLCKNIFEELGYGRVELQPLSGDGGKDLIIYGQQGKIVVECKHQPNTSIGRPIIQKLHSAVISEGASMGIVVTSGKFSAQALEHSKTLQPKIELIDSGLLLDLASRAGIRIVTEYGHQTIQTFSVLGDQDIDHKIYSLITNVMTSYPEKSAEVLGIRNRHIFLRPVYKIGYQINADFTTTIGRIHSINKQGIFFIDGNNGSVLRQDLDSFFTNIPRSIIRSWTDVSRESKGVSNTPFKIPVSIVKETAYQNIIKSNSVNVQYTGRNNQTYSKSCEPNRSQVFIGNITQMYIPEYSINYVLAGREQSISFAHNGKPDIFVYSDSTNNCRYCDGQIQGKRHLCLECGTIACSKKVFFKTKSHGQSCEICGKSLCHDCANYVSKFIFLKTIVCKDCGDNIKRQGKNVKKLRPVS
jgi:restriction system protein